MRTPRTAFTLIELLVVVAIIVALLSILMPSMGRAVIAANRAVCASNLHQVHAGLMSYASDSFGIYPPLGSAVDDGKPPGNLNVWKKRYATPLVERYLGNDIDVLFCPFHMDEAQREAYYDYPWDQVNLGQDSRKASSYIALINLMLDPQSSWSNPNLYLRRDAHHARTSDQTKEPILLADLVRWRTNASDWDLSDRNLDAAGDPEGGNQATVDGSVGWKPFREMTKNFTPSAGYYSEYYW